MLVDKWHEPTSNESKQKRLSPLLGRKEIELDEALNEIAAIARKSLGVLPHVEESKITQFR